MKKTNSRRSFLKNAGLAIPTLGVLGSCQTNTENQQQNPVAKMPEKSNFTGVVTRRNIGDLAPDDPSLQVLKDAVRILKERSARSPLEPTGWDAHGAIHASFCATNNYINQVHYSWFVWPWHRAYLWSMEKKLQKAVGEPQLALHYWDWTKQRKIPAVYWEKDGPMNNASRLILPEDEIPKDFLNVGAALRAPNFSIFGGHPHITKPGQPQIDGIAENTFHNSIHNWIGGDMASFHASGFDPIFYAHHGNCDRLWDAWLNYAEEHQLPTDEDWLEKELFVTDEKGMPLRIKIREVLNTTDLGYEFADLDFNAEFENPFSEEIKPQIAHYDSDAKTQVTIGKVCREGIVEHINSDNRTYIMMHFDRVQLPYQPYCARIFFNIPGLTNIKYIGTYTMLPIVKPGGSLLEEDVYLQMEVDEDVIQAIQEDKKIEVVFEPVPLRNRAIPDINLKLENVELLLA